MSAASPRKAPSVGVALSCGLPLAAAILSIFHLGPLHGTTLARYVEHPAQWVTVAFFCVGLASLLQRLWLLRGERAALDASFLPTWDGKAQPITKAAELLAATERHHASKSWLGRRICALLDFVKKRGSADQVDDQLRALGDADAASHDAGYSFLRFVTWAIPILGFLGTVIGITTAIGGVSPEALEGAGMSALTGGLSEAFDSTALALGLTMLLMFLTNIVERMEQSVLDEVDGLAEGMLAHRFARKGAETAPVVEALREQTEALLAAHGGPVAQMVEVLQMRMMAAMQQTMGDTLTQFAQHTAALVQQLTSLSQAVRETSQQQQNALIRVAEGITGQAAVLARLQEGETNLVHLQAVLHQNLAALASASDFEQAVHMLTAAAHMLTAKVGGGPRLTLHGAAA
jgi:biopolymer transport protein ExbB/TolQ